MSINVDKQLIEVENEIKRYNFLNARELFDKISNRIIDSEQRHRYSLTKLRLLIGIEKHNDALEYGQSLLEALGNNHDNLYLDTLFLLIRNNHALGRYDELKLLFEKIETLLATDAIQNSKNFNIFFFNYLLEKYEFFSTLGQINLAFEILSECEKRFVEIPPDSELIFKFYYAMAMIHIFNGKHEISNEYAIKCLRFSKKSKIKLQTAISLTCLSQIKHNLGDFRVGLDYGLEATKLARVVANKKVLASALNTVANCYDQLGEVRKALKLREEILEITKESGNRYKLAVRLTNSSFSHKLNGNLEEALNLLRKSLDIFKMLNNPFGQANSLYEIILICVDLNQLDLATSYFNQIKKFEDTETNPIIQQEIKLAEAYILKKSRRLKDKFKAQDIFEMISKTDSLHIDLYIFALLNFSELLLDEIFISNQKNLVKEIETITELLHNTAKRNNSWILLVQSLLLHSKLLLLENKLTEASELLVKAFNLSEEKNLSSLRSIVVKEKNTIEQYAKNVQTEDFLRLSYSERLEMTHIQNLITSMLQKRVLDDNIVFSLNEIETIRKEFIKRRDMFIDVTNHELRTPLTALIGFFNILENNYQKLDQKEREKIFAVINRNLFRLQKLISQVSSLSEIDQGEFIVIKSEFNFKEFLVDALKPYKLFLKESLSFKSTADEQAVIIKGDKDKLTEVLDNILNNAIRNTNPQNRMINVELMIKEKWISLQITDNGTGIDIEHIPQLFNQFVRFPTSFSASGSGLGLFICKMIIEAHSGSITAFSEGIGYGSTFKVILPRIK